MANIDLDNFRVVWTGNPDVERNYINDILHALVTRINQVEAEIPSGGGDTALSGFSFLTAVLESGLDSARQLVGEAGVISINDQGAGAQLVVGIEDAGIEADKLHVTGTPSSGTFIGDDGTTMIYTELTSADASIVIDTSTPGIIDLSATGGGGGSVNSVTDDGNTVVSVDNTDPANPVVTLDSQTGNTFIGNNAAFSAPPIALTATQATAMLDEFVGNIKGLVPSYSALPGTPNAYLASDGTWGNEIPIPTSPADDNAVLWTNGTTWSWNSDLTIDGSGNVVIAGTMTANDDVIAGSIGTGGHDMYARNYYINAVGSLYLKDVDSVLYDCFRFFADGSPLTELRFQVGTIGTGLFDFMTVDAATGVVSFPNNTFGTGTVTSFSAGNLSPLFTTNVATATTTPALTFTLSNAAAHTFFGNNTGSTAAPAFVSLTAADLPNTAVSPGTYGDGTHVGQFTVDQQGRLTSASNVAITYPTSAAPVDIQEFLTVGTATWNKPSGAKWIHVFCVGGGGGGASGGGPGASISGNGGGGGGACNDEWFPASAVPSSVTVTVGAGGAGGASVGAANGLPGSPGGASSFGSLVTGYGGGQGGAATGNTTNSGGGGGGKWSVGGTGNSGAASQGGAGGGLGDSPATAGGDNGNTVGGAPGGGGTSAGTGGTNGGRANAGARGGGAGGAAAGIGAAGGNAADEFGVFNVLGGAIGTANPGQSTAGVNASFRGNGGGGGCGHSATSTGPGTSGGAGGAGQQPGGGGGGGGAESQATKLSGAGGKGGDGGVRVITYF